MSPVKPVFAGVAYVKFYRTMNRVIVALPHHIIVAPNRWTWILKRQRHANIDRLLQKRGLLPPKRVPRLKRPNT
jgi:hypothetical protein